MLLTDSIHHALRALTAQRLRSFLTLLGIGVGTAAVILLTSIGEGIHRFVLAEFTQFGTNIVSLSPGKVKSVRCPGFSVRRVQYAGSSDCTDQPRLARASADTSSNSSVKLLAPAPREDA